MALGRRTGRGGCRLVELSDEHLGETHREPPKLRYGAVLWPNRGGEYGEDEEENGQQTMLAVIGMTTAWEERAKKKDKNKFADSSGQGKKLGVGKWGFA